jgi:phage-related minor tail protein
MPFANGGVVSSPTFFPMAGRNTGLMGEAGPEAIMPLARINGKLGVRMAGGSGGSEVGVYVNVLNYGSSEVSTERGAGGRLDIVIRDQVKGAIADGHVDRELRQRFNIRPAVQGF